MRRVAAIGVSIILAASACGGDDDTAGPSTSTGDDSAREQPDDGEVQEQDVEADRAAAEAALLTLADFPAGWSEVPDTDDDDDEELNRRQAECLGMSGTELIDTEASAETGTFTDPVDDSRVDQIVGLATTTDDATSRLAGFTDDGVTLCLTEVYNDRFRALIEETVELGDAELGDITVGALNITPVGDEAHAFRVAIPISVDTFEVTAVGDLVAVRVGRSIAGLTFFSEDGATPIERIDEYTGLAASRLPG